MWGPNLLVATTRAPSPEACAIVTEDTCDLPGAPTEGRTRLVTGLFNGTGLPLEVACYFDSGAAYPSIQIEPTPHARRVVRSGMAVRALLAQIERLRRTPCPTMRFGFSPGEVASAVAAELEETLAEQAGSRASIQEAAGVVATALHLAYSLTAIMSPEAGIEAVIEAIEWESSKLSRRLDYVSAGKTWAEAKLFDEDRLGAAQGIASFWVRSLSSSDISDYGRRTLERLPELHAWVRARATHVARSPGWTTHRHRWAIAEALAEDLTVPMQGACDCRGAGDSDWLDEDGCCRSCGGDRFHDHAGEPSGPAWKLCVEAGVAAFKRDDLEGHNDAP